MFYHMPLAHWIKCQFQTRRPVCAFHLLSFSTLCPTCSFFFRPSSSQISWVNFIGIWAVRLTRYYNFYSILWRVILKKNKILNAFSVLLFTKRGTNPVLLLDNPAEKHNLVFFVFPQ